MRRVPMFTASEKDTQIQFRGGMFGLLVPFIVLFAGIILLSVSGQALPMEPANLERHKREMH